MRKKIIVLLTSLLILCCKTIEEKSINKPNVMKVDTVLIESSKGNQENGATAIIEFVVFFDRDEISDISSMIIESPVGSKWTFDKKIINDKYNPEDLNIYFDTLTSSLHKHYLPLGKYSLIINFSNYSQTLYHFDVYGRGDVTMSSGKIYSEEVENTPKILTIPENYSARITDNDLILEFESTDEIINNGYIWLYNDEKNCIGVEGWFSDIKDFESIGFNQYVFDITNINDEIKHVELVLYSDTTTMNDKTRYWCRTGDFPITE